MKKLTAILAVSMFCATTQAQLWDESIKGDASSNPMAPSNAGTVALGSNIFKGTVTNSGGADPRDYITFVVPAGLSITSLILLDHAPNDISWTHFDDGPTSVIPDPGNAASLLAGAHIAAAQPNGSDLFANYQTGSPNLLAGPGFSGPIGPGTYTFLMQQTGTVLQTYSLDFIVVPAPGFAGVGAMGALMLARRRR